ncbi:TRAP transporter small permease [Marinobacterium rhizophilum]|uniref:TRAP transporter small permease protein n=1 Tax=Marinobacterium rhizophilum TaxID=420402 RepID=A0ABY5HP14_9GAMM|nr:TRAP transporter small permease [Marinobacterium rhizophilum]UTW14173.1 TRAP transporter small permease [Marinobacterium rhizophilum]
MDTVTELPETISVHRLYHGLYSGCGLLAALMFALMALLVCADIALRNMTSFSLSWTVEASEYLLMTATMLAAPWLLYCGDHIRIDLALQLMTPRWRTLFERGLSLLGAIICGVLSWYSLEVTLDTARQGGLVFKVLVFPQWWLNLPMIAGFVLLTVEFVRRLLNPVSVVKEAR